MSTGRTSMRLMIGMDRFYKRNAFKSGAGAISYWHCLDKKCTSKVKARYPDHNTVNEDEPEVDGRPTPHVIKITGVIHPPYVGKRLKEMAQTKIKKIFKENPLRAVAEAHEDVVNKMLETLADRTDREEFIRAMPSSRNSARTEYKDRARIIPPTPSNARDIRMDSRLVLTFFTASLS